MLPEHFPHLPSTRNHAHDQVLFSALAIPSGIVFTLGDLVLEDASLEAAGCGWVSDLGVFDECGRILVAFAAEEIARQFLGRNLDGPLGRIGHFFKDFYFGERDPVHLLYHKINK